MQQLRFVSERTGEAIADLERRRAQSMPRWPSCASSTPRCARRWVAGTERFGRLDALRGAAIVWMALFHLAFDLNHFGWLNPKQNFYTDPL